MHNPKQEHEPVRQDVHVDCPIDDAYRLFTEAIGEWCPWSKDCQMEPWEGGRLFERTPAGEEVEWGTVKTWDPPHRVEFTWHPSDSGNDEQTVDVEFRVEADGTRVTVTHSGWEHAGAAVCSAQIFSARRFAEFVAEMLVVA